MRGQVVAGLLRKCSDQLTASAGQCWCHCFARNCPDVCKGRSVWPPKRKATEGCVACAKLVAAWHARLGCKHILRYHVSDALRRVWCTVKYAVLHVANASCMGVCMHVGWLTEQQPSLVATTAPSLVQLPVGPNVRATTTVRASKWVAV